MLLAHSLLKLEVVRMWGYILHLTLHAILPSWKLLLRLDHAHAHILLVRRSNLLLLCLKNFNLLRDGKLLHCDIFG